MPVFSPPDLLMNINGTVMVGLKAIERDVVVSGGNAVFYLTDNNAATGNAIFNNVYVKQFQGVEVDSAFAYGLPVLSADKKTLTVAVKKTGAAVVILGISVIGALTAANGSNISAFIVGD